MLHNDWQYQWQVTLSNKYKGKKEKKVGKQGRSPTPADILVDM